jgi:hypothetical protein
MKIRDVEYTKESFKAYLKENAEELCKEEKRRYWLKIYCILVSNDTWKNLFQNDEIEQLGEIFKITLKGDDENLQENVYYLMEYQKGLLLLFTTANQEIYEKNLSKRLDQSRGAASMWINPDLFRLFWQGVLKETDGYISRFVAHRLSFDTDAVIRPNYTRRISYSGKDATQTLEEVVETYGVRPSSIYIQVSSDLQVHLTNKGLFSAQIATPEVFDLFYKYLDIIKIPILQIKDISSAFKFELVKDSFDLKKPKIEAGTIKLNAGQFDELLARNVIKNLSKTKRFSFINTHTEYGSFSFSAIVIDEIKGSVFNVNMVGSEIRIIPKFDSTFESFMSLYQEFVETIDKNAQIIISEA